MLIRNVLDAKGRRAITISPEATIKEALALFVTHNIGSLPVLDEAGRLVGIFSERDMLFVAHERGPSFRECTVAEVMTSSPITCSPGDLVHEVMGLVTHHRIGQLPVVDDDQLVGVVSAGDLIKAMYELAEDEKQHLVAYVHGRA